MVNGQLSGAWRRLFGRNAGVEDAELLGRFAEHRDEDAFAALLRLHGPMVLGVCRRVLGDEQDAEDVFQATFLVLARKAASIRSRGTLADWLYRVASRLALAVRSASSRRIIVERQATPMQQTDPTAEIAWRDLRPVLDEELSRLPEKYRLPVVLCYLEGKTHAEAAGELGWPCGTVAGRLARARELLRGRLARRGLGLSSAVLATLLAGQTAPAAVPAVVLRVTLKTAVGCFLPTTGPLASTPVKLAERMLRTMSTSRRNVVALFCLLALVATGAGTATLLGPAPPEKPRPAEPAPAVSKRPRVDLLGDPLPPGAVLRLGTTRFRHAGNLFGPVFSPDGKTFVTGDGYGLVRLWDRGTGRELRRFLKRGEYIQALGLAADGKVLVVASLDGSLRLWDVASGKELRRVRPEQQNLSLFTFSPNGRTLAAASFRGGVRLCDPVSGKTRRRLPGLSDGQSALAFSPNGTLLGAGGDRCEIWEVATGKRLRQLRFGPVHALAFSGDGKTLATGTGRKGDPVWLWDVRTGKEIDQLPVAGAVTSLLFSADGRTLFVGTDSTVLVLDAASGREKRRLGRHRFGTHLALSPDGRVLAAGNWEGNLRLWDAALGRPLLPLPGHQSWVTAVACAPDGRTVATGGGDGTARLWSLASGRELARFEGSGGVGPVCFAPDGKLLAAGSERAVHVWEVAGGKEKRVPRRCAHPAFSPDGKLLAAAERGTGRVVLWEPATGKIVRRLGPVGKGSETLYGLSFAPDGKTLAAVLRETTRGAAAPGDAVLYVWDVAGGKELRALTRPQFGALCLAFSPDGRTLAAGTEQGTVHLWDARSGKEEFVLRLPPSRINGLAFSPDGRTLATAGSADGKVRLWEVLTGRPRRQFVGHHPNVTSVAFTPDGRHVVSGSEDGTALVWDLAGLGPRANEKRLPE